jgi:hypothetical protein
LFSETLLVLDRYLMNHNFTFINRSNAFLISNLVLISGLIDM